MDKFTPLTRRGLIAALILIPLTFSVYYVGLYPPIIQNYEQSFIKAEFFKNGWLDVKVHYPSYVADFVEREIVVDVKNLAPTSISPTVIVSATTSIVTGDPKKDPRIHIAAKSNGLESSTATNNALLLNLPPNGLASGELMISIQNASVVSAEMPLDATLTFYVSITDTVNQLIPEPSTTTLTTTFSREKAFRQSAIRYLILPPWSNGILPIVVIAAVWFSENRWLARCIGWLVKKFMPKPQEKLIKHIRRNVICYNFLEWLALVVSAILLLAWLAWGVHIFLLHEIALSFELGIWSVFLLALVIAYGWEKVPVLLPWSLPELLGVANDRLRSVEKILNDLDGRLVSAVQQSASGSSGELQPVVEGLNAIKNKIETTNFLINYIRREYEEFKHDIRSGNDIAALTDGGQKLSISERGKPTKCQRCGNQVKDDAHFCPNCGANLDAGFDPSPEDPGSTASNQQE